MQIHISSNRTRLIPALLATLLALALTGCGGGDDLEDAQEAPQASTQPVQHPQGAL